MVFAIIQKNSQYKDTCVGVSSDEVAFSYGVFTWKPIYRPGDIWLTDITFLMYLCERKKRVPADRLYERSFLANIRI